VNDAISWQSTQTLGAVVITSHSALAGTAAAVGISAAFLPAIHSHPTVLSLAIGLCAWGVIAFIKSGQFADGHFALVWATAVLLHIISFSIPATVIWLSLRKRRPRTCSVMVGIWCLCYLSFLLILFPALAGP
jgi:hypothetical protein